MRPEDFQTALQNAGAGFATGVPDSLLAEFCACVDETLPRDRHVIAANEGNAVAIAAGYHLATGDIPLVYLQNSGLGNCINPLVSLTDPDVYGLPMVLIIGWRGEPGIKDEPQHVKQGALTPGQLDLLGIPVLTIEAASDPDTVAQWAVQTAREGSHPVALLVRKGTFEPFAGAKRHQAPGVMRREEALAYLLDLAGDALVLATTGKTAREVYELRTRTGDGCADFLTVGSMGHASSIALGVSIGAHEREVVCLDGDGAALMHLGAMPVLAGVKPKNFTHVLLNNAAHESVGGQPTVAGDMDWGLVARGFGYGAYAQADSAESLSQAWRELAGAAGPRLLEVLIDTGSRDDLGRPKSTPSENGRAFMQRARS